MKVELASVEDDFDQLAQQMGKIMDEMLERNFVRFRWTQQWRPSVNLYEADDRYVVCVDLAGMDHRRIEIHVENQKLTISGTRPGPRPGQAQGEIRVRMMEIDEGPFSRELALAGDVDPTRIAARYCKGYLWIDLPRSSG